MMPEYFLVNSELPTLKVVSRPLNDDSIFAGDEVLSTNPVNPLLWLQNGSGFVGDGEVLRLNFFGENRFDEATSVWQKLGAKAVVDDAVQVPGSGLLAFTAFTFAAASKRASVMIVPQRIFAKLHGASWVTTIEILGDEKTRVADLHKQTPLGQAPVASFYEPLGEANAYREGVKEASQRIADGVAEKIVLARRLQSALPAGDLRVALKSLAQKYPNCWTFAVDGMLGASPETLIRSVAGRVTAKVLAGTRKRSLDKERDLQMKKELLESVKEQFEHKLAVDSLTQTLQPFVTDLLVEPRPHLLKLPNVWHLATNVSASLAHGANVIELAGAVHPTAAVAGTPTQFAVQTIAELEPFDRERYAGAVGWVDARGDGDFAIALRSAQINGFGAARTITAYAGGGLVAGSDPWHELTETVAKFRPVIEAFS